jgi:hypothetical protein
MWAFEGTGDAVRIQEYENGSFSVYGNLATQDCRPGGGDLSILEVLGKVDSSSLFFRIHTSDSEAHHIDGVGRGLLEAFRAKPTRSHGMIEYYPKDQSPSMIAVTVILCEGSIAHVIDMYKRLFGRRDLHHRIVLDFFGFLPKPHPESDLLSTAQFTDPDILSRKAHLTDSVSFSFYSDASEPAPLSQASKDTPPRAQEIPDALVQINRQLAMFGRWIGIAVTVIAVIAVLFYLRH